MRFSPEQEKIVEHQTGSLLVSAAAGSGKTTTMVGHVLKRLETLDIRQMVILTYTRPAAAEMRQRIMKELTKALEKDPGNTHLRRQLYGVPLAAIGTIDSFCMNLVRDHFDRLELTPDLRIADDKEMGLLKDEILEQVLEEAYEAGRESFFELRSSYSSEKNHDSLKSILLNLHAVSQNDADPAGWLRHCLRHYPAVEEFAESPLMQQFYQKVRQRGEEALHQAKALKEWLAFDTPALEQVGDDIRIIESLLAGPGGEAMVQAIGALKFASRTRKASDEAKDSLDRFRGKASGGEGYLALLCGAVKGYRGLEEEWRLLKLTEAPLKELIELTLVFSQRLQQACRDKSLTDFSGLEHYALELLMQPDASGVRQPTELAETLRERFREVIVDEYQDVNQIQEYILQALAGPNLFMVGDVKQSIYRFRRAKPSIIVEKYRRYEENPASLCRRIDLKENYRSRPEVLEGANELFGAIMSEAAGGVDYDEKASLKAAAAYEGAGFEPRAVFIETDSQAEEGAREQARYIAGEIHRLLEEDYQVYEPQDKLFRPLELKDIVILLRKKKRARLLAEELERFGIPAVYPRKSGFFDRREVRQMLALLAVVDNPRQDIPLAALMLSPIGGFSEEDLARIKTRTEEPAGQELWDRLEQLKEEASIGLLMERINSWRRLADYRPLSELVQDLFELSGFEAYLKAKPWEGSLANIKELVQLAREFEGNRSQGLYAFLQYLEQQKKLNLEDRGEAEQLVAGAQAVQIDSIHASKGLEFPVVFLALCETKFDTRDSQGDYFSDEQEGIALQSVDTKQYVKTENLAYYRVQERVIQESLSEEIRLLYVAMTRAKERFYLLGRAKDREKAEEKLHLLLPPKGRLPLSLVQEQNNYMRLYLAARVNGCLPHFPEEWIRTEDLPRAESRSWPALSGQVDPALSESFSEAGEQAENPYRYHYPEAMKAAYAVSELVKKAESSQRGEAETPAVPDPLEMPESAQGTLQELRHLGGADRGTLYHRVMEYIPWEQGEKEEHIRAFLQTGIERGLFRQEEVRKVDPALPAAFFRDPVGQRSLKAFRAGKLWREQPFMMSLPYHQIDPAFSGVETVLVQGIIDLFFEEEGQLILVDYKTDSHVTPTVLRERHGAQLAYYARALEAARNQPVSEVYIYSFFLGCFVPVELS